ncbi:unnamed protein product [Ceratitis capitata]|uniref:(Mediterranean fruit fly) hypothetical protein n=1 Tax=Ceratitis capitata TaxID=7213 RepID=A0A811V7G9_CERCA|nr:unnamed protein product [Ceratitis capitata]
MAAQQHCTITKPDWSYIATTCHMPHATCDRQATRRQRSIVMFTLCGMVCYCDTAHTANAVNLLFSSAATTAPPVPPVPPVLPVCHRKTLRLLICFHQAFVLLPRAHTHTNARQKIPKLRTLIPYFGLLYSPSPSLCSLSLSYSKGSLHVFITKTLVSIKVCPFTSKCIENNNNNNNDNDNKINVIATTTM